MAEGTAERGCCTQSRQPEPQDAEQALHSVLGKPQGVRPGERADGQVGSMEPLGAKVKGGPKRALSLGCRMTTTEVIRSFQKPNGSWEPGDSRQGLF